MQSSRALLLLAGLTACASVASPEPCAELLRRPGTVLFLGDSITWNGAYVADFEACWRAAHPGSQTRIVQLGLPSETVSGLSEEGHAGGAFPRPVLSERLERTLDAIQPQLVFACYGMNDGIYQPLDPARFAAFRVGIEALERACAVHGARLVLLTPPLFDALPGGANAPCADYDEVLAAYSSWLVQRGKEVVDVHTAMRQLVAERRRSQPAFTVAPDGVHPDALGHWWIARELLRHCGVAAAASAESCAQFLATVGAGAQLRPLVGERQQLLRDAWLTAVDHTRPGLPTGVPLAQAQQRAGELDAAVAQQVPAPPETPPR